MRIVYALVLAIAFSGCGIPRDPEGTLDRVTGGVMRVGFTLSEPWVSVSEGRPAGVEVELLRRFASELDAEIEWFDGSEADLMAALEMRELDAVIGGLTSTNPWASKVAMTHPYYTSQVQVGTPAGAAIVGVIGVGLGLWWADAVAASVISLDILHDGIGNLRAVVSDLMDSKPTTVDHSAADPLPARIENELKKLDWVRDARVRMREEGHVIFGEALVVARHEEGLTTNIEEANERLRNVDWRMHDLVIMPVADLEEGKQGANPRALLHGPRRAESTRSARRSVRYQALLAQESTHLFDACIGARQHELRRAEVVVGQTPPASAHPGEQLLESNPVCVNVPTLDGGDELLVELVELLQPLLGDVELALPQDADDHCWSSRPGASSALRSPLPSSFRSRAISASTPGPNAVLSSSA